MFSCTPSFVASRIYCAADLSICYTSRIMLDQGLRTIVHYANMFAAVWRSGFDSFFQHYIVFACSNLPSRPGKADQHAHVGRVKRREWYQTATEGDTHILSCMIAAHSRRIAHQHKRCNSVCLIYMHEMVSRLAN